MKNIFLISAVIIILLLFVYLFKPYNSYSSYSYSEQNSDSININDLKVLTIDGTEKSLSDYNGKVLLVVNVASKCGYTPQYEGMQRLYDRFNSQGFEILAFPCNDFKNQEPGTNEEIAEFCRTNYNITFQLFDKIKVLGEDRSPLYERLIQFEPAGDISWNFEKFIVDKNGNVVARFKSNVKPESEEIISIIEGLLIQ